MSGAPYSLAHVEPLPRHMSRQRLRIAQPRANVTPQRRLLCEALPFLTHSAERGMSGKLWPCMEGAVPTSAKQLFWRNVCKEMRHELLWEKAEPTKCHLLGMRYVVLLRGKVSMRLFSRNDLNAHARTSSKVYNAKAFSTEPSRAVTSGTNAAKNALDRV